jgi:hypothetical protein
VVEGACRKRGAGEWSRLDWERRGGAALDLARHFLLQKFWHCHALDTLNKHTWGYAPCARGKIGAASTVTGAGREEWYTLRAARNPPHGVARVILRPDIDAIVQRGAIQLARTMGQVSSMRVVLQEKQKEEKQEGKVGLWV